MKLEKTVGLIFILLVAIGTSGGQQWQNHKISTRSLDTPPSTNCSCGYTNINQLRLADRIVGGVDALLHEFPFMSALVYDMNPAAVFCGGTIITKRHVLTASHCKPRRNRKASVIFAEHNTESTTESASVMISIKTFVTHENFNETGATENDVAVALMAEEIPFSKIIGPACFPGVGLQDVLVGQKVRIIGWGLLYDEGYQPDVLQKIDVSVVPLKECDAIYRAINNGSLCTYTLKKDACQGDSGGPVVHMNPETKRYTIMGIVSRGIGCAEPKTPAVNTNVSFFRDWILRKIAETDPTAATCAEI